ncbi:hypothetical protein E4U30_008316 [Claviceps sp. LM220 group G6]|nr:hypothetical protein E4U30_008316 [Claviceps sp. LM220 group G6]
MTTFLEDAPENTTGNLSEPCSADEAMYSLQDIPGKGKGLVATREIPKGTRILSEQPLITLPIKVPAEKVPDLLSRQWESLNIDQRTAYLSLHNNVANVSKNDRPQLVSIFYTNCREYGREDRLAIFMEASRINHDCESNTEGEWNPNIKRHTVHAIKDIHAGEEITLCYAGAGYHDTRASEKKSFQRDHKFVCSCHTCNLPAEQREERDRKLLQISTLRWIYTDTAYKCPPIRSLRYLDAQARIYSELNREDLGFALTFELAADLVISHGDLARGRIFAQKAESIYKTVLGSDSPMTIKFADMARDPSRHDRYGLSMCWRMAVDDIPHGLEPHDFEEWLWIRDEPFAPAKALIPPKQSFFSGFDDLPYKEDIGTNGSFKKRHWCFLGQIREPLLVIPLDLQVMDVRGKKLRVHLYTEKNGVKESPPKDAQLGYTVAVLDATKHDFEFGPPGIRLEDARMIKCFPLPLAKILALVKEVRQFSKPTHNDCRNCDGCGNSAAVASMKRCSGCLLSWYCNKDCQMVGWVTKGHKASCKLFRDPDLRSLLCTKWDEVQDSVSFPLKVADGSC